MKLNFGIIHKKRVSVSDIKQYLVDEFKNNNDMQQQIYRLKDELKEKVKIQIKYDATLVTLDEFKCRLDEKEKRIKELESQIENLNKDIKHATDEKNSKILEYRKLNDMYDNLNKKFDVEIARQLDFRMKKFVSSKIDEINSLKGHIKKDDIIKILGG